MRSPAWSSGKGLAACASQRSEHLLGACCSHVPRWLRRHQLETQARCLFQNSLQIPTVQCPLVPHHLLWAASAARIARIILQWTQDQAKGVCRHEKCSRASHVCVEHRRAATVPAGATRHAICHQHERPPLCLLWGAKPGWVGLRRATALLHLHMCCWRCCRLLMRLEEAVGK